MKRDTHKKKKKKKMKRMKKENMKRKKKKRKKKAKKNRIKGDQGLVKLKVHRKCMDDDTRLCQVRGESIRGIGGGREVGETTL